MLEKILNITPESIGLINFINYYNGYRGFSKSKYSLQNSIVSKIQKIIKSPSNQLLATIPVSIQSWHDGAAKAKKIRFAQMQKALED
jgi:chromosome condensin MukBEF complex kleisin-like MukF subunit